MKKTAALHRKALRGVTTRDYTAGVKAPASTHRGGETSVIQELAALAGFGQAVSVRAAKAHLSGLLEPVARGQEVVITSAGVPKARILPMDRALAQKVFTGTWEHLARMPKWSGGPTADELIREARDARG